MSGNRRYSVNLASTSLTDSTSNTIALIRSTLRTCMCIGNVSIPTTATVRVCRSTLNRISCIPIVSWTHRPCRPEIISSRDVVATLMSRLQCRHCRPLTPTAISMRRRSCHWWRHATSVLCTTPICQRLCEHPTT